MSRRTVRKNLEKLHLIHLELKPDQDVILLVGHPPNAGHPSQNPSLPQPSPKLTKMAKPLATRISFLSTETPLTISPLITAQQTP